MKQACKTCRFFSGLAVDPTDCRKNPPTLALVPSQRGGPMTYGVFPPTKPDNWCGAYEAAETDERTTS